MSVGGNMKLYVFSGIPGAGKSYIARALRDSMDCTYVSSDDIRAEKFSCPVYDHEENAAVFGEFHRRVYHGLFNGDVIADATFLRTKDLKPLKHIASEHMADKILIYVDTPADIRQARILARDYPEPTGCLLAAERMAGLGPLAKERANIVLDGTMPVEDNVAKCKL